MLRPWGKPTNMASNSKLPELTPTLVDGKVVLLEVKSSSDKDGAPSSNQLIFDDRQHDKYVIVETTEQQEEEETEAPLSPTPDPAKKTLANPSDDSGSDSEKEKANDPDYIEESAVTKSRANAYSTSTSDDEDETPVAPKRRKKKALPDEKSLARRVVKTVLGDPGNRAEFPCDEQFGKSAEKNIR